jgi:hypothetical protein
MLFLHLKAAAKASCFMPDNTSLIPAEASVGYLAALDGIADGSSIRWES